MVSKKRKTPDPKETRINELLDSLLEDYKGDNPEAVIGKNGLLKLLTKRLVERAMESEMDDHVGYSKHSSSGTNSGNSRNGRSRKIITGEFGEAEIEIPRDRNGEFEPQIIKKHQRRFEGFDNKIISMYSRGMSTREIRSHLEEIYGVDVSAELISHVTDGVIDEVKEWQARPLDKIYPILYLDALVLKIRDEGRVINKHIYLVLAVNMEGNKELLGMWVQQNEGAKFWLQVITDLKNRGLEDIFIACVDGLKGFPEAINSVYPKTEVQLCIVHMIRNSLRFVSYKQRKKIADDLKKIYGAPTEEKAKSELEEFGKIWDGSYPTISKMWKSHWENIIPFFAYAPEIRRVIYTTNAIESLNMSLRKVTKTRGSFPNDDAAFKLLYLGIRNASKKWTMPIRNWGMAVQQFSILFGDRVPMTGI